uniref:Uncharacterized protein n=1 Tax=Plectus sambesii TaxID=2011161 RepID=A0A914X5L2_9BILA
MCPLRVPVKSYGYRPTGNRPHSQTRASSRRKYKATTRMRRDRGPPAIIDLQDARHTRHFHVCKMDAFERQLLAAAAAAGQVLRMFDMAVSALGDTGSENGNRSRVRLATESRVCKPRR